MSAAPKPVAPPPTRDPDLDKDIVELANEVLPWLGDDTQEWLHRPNPRFNLDTPAELIGTPREALLRNLLRAAKQGAFS